MVASTIITMDDATIAYDQTIIRYFELAGIVLFLYDYLLTLGSEVKYIWKPGHARTTAWYLFVRYFCLFTNMGMRVSDFGNLSPKAYGVFDLPRFYLTGLHELIVGCTLILRVLAMYSFDKRVMFTLVTAALICVSLAAWCVVPVGPALTYNTRIPGCHTPSSEAQLVRTAGAWEALLAGDVLLLAFTLWRGYTQTRDVELPSGSLWRVLVRDGAMYFVLSVIRSFRHTFSTDLNLDLCSVICLANLANILMYYFGDINTATSLSGFTASLSVTMICRLMLNLHEAAAISSSDSRGSALTQSLQFAAGPQDESGMASEGFDDA
ncbi:hypothetical protein DFH08DRAFT_966734 [Mycena albidolilacea]|uniref:DUF6533 domain-containing protein n=1 Tax=Mycena albidolilacea TaxID=1033008 RepID=A0AAD7EKY9_9AGAR|nr:hypothetical protein DFH08DRAFT_966734 [Mycena albidolilacea]